MHHRMRPDTTHYTSVDIHLSNISLFPRRTFGGDQRRIPTTPCLERVPCCLSKPLLRPTGTKKTIRAWLKVNIYLFSIIYLIPACFYTSDYGESSTMTCTPFDRRQSILGTLIHCLWRRSTSWVGLGLRRLWMERVEARWLKSFATSGSRRQNGSTSISARLL